MRQVVLDRIVATALDVSIRSSREPTSGAVADTYVLELDDWPTGLENDSPTGLPRVVCKRGGASVWSGDVVEPFVVDLVRSTTELPVPRVLATGSLRGGPSDGLDRWALYDYLEGATARGQHHTHESEMFERLISQAGALLGRLHATHSFDRIGALARSDERLVLTDPDGWHGMLSTPVLATLSAVRTSSGNDNRPSDFHLHPVLTHGDYHPGNLLVDDKGSVTAVLDWGNAHVTHAGYALARAEARFVDSHRFTLQRRRDKNRPPVQNHRRTFREAYARHASIEPGFSDRAPLYKTLWLAQSAANYARILRSSRGRTQIARQIRSGLARIQP